MTDDTDVTPAPEQRLPTAEAIDELVRLGRARSRRDRFLTFLIVVMVVVVVGVPIAYSRLAASRAQRAEAKAQQALDVGRQRLHLSEQNQKILRNTSEIVAFIADSQTDEARAAQAKRLTDAITLIGCDTGGKIQQLADALAESGAITPIDVECPRPGGG